MSAREPAAATRLQEPSSSAHRRSAVVPYITAWSSEQPLTADIVQSGQGIGYADEVLHDRDARGVLWRRVGMSPGKGRPEFGRVHSLRQRRAMTRRLCQVCGKPASTTAKGTLWLLSEDAEEYAAHAGVPTPHPPVCIPCARTATQACPDLRRKRVALRVRKTTVVGAHGVLYQPGFPRPTVDEVTGVAFDNWRINWLAAGQLLVRLDECTVVDLAAEAAALPSA